MKAPKHQQRVHDAQKISTPYWGWMKMLRQVVFQMRARKRAAPGKRLHPPLGTDLSRLTRYSASSFTTESSWRAAGFRDATPALPTSIWAEPTAAEDGSRPADVLGVSIGSQSCRVATEVRTQVFGNSDPSQAV